MKVILRLVGEQFCAGCSAKGFVVEATYLCLNCTNLRLLTLVRTKKLQATLSQRFAGQVQQDIQVRVWRKRIRDILTPRKIQEERTK
jgi:hypothetical protein